MDTPYYDAKLSELDISAIRQIIAGLRNVDHRILSVRLERDDLVRVRTGFVTGPLSGGGNQIWLTREGEGWVVTSTGHWIA